MTIPAGRTIVRSDRVARYPTPPLPTRKRTRGKMAAVKRYTPAVEALIALLAEIAANPEAQA